MNSSVLITNIQRFSLHDGPGIRTTIFLKGCSLHCPWCSNPENITPIKEKYYADGKNGIYGKEIKLSEIYAEVVKDRLFYEHNGGVTFSGGEPLLFIKKLEPLLKKIKDENISIATETSLFAPQELLNLALQYIDYFCIDIKIINEEKCRKILGGELKNYINNVKTIQKSTVKTLFRFPIILPYTTNTENIHSVASFCLENDIHSLELIIGHNLASKKYLSLNRKIHYIPNMENEDIQEIVNFFETQNIKAKICRV